MKATVVILGTVEEQRANGDLDIVDPKGVKSEGESTLWANFSYRVPEDVLGRVSAIRVEEGRLVGDVEFLDGEFKPDRDILNQQNVQYGVQGMVLDYTVRRDNVREISSFTLLAVGASAKGAKRRG